MSLADQAINDTVNNQKKASGAWIGMVEDVDDPSGHDRVKVRIPSLHPPSIEVDKLPWATVNSLFGGVEDTGSSGGVIEGATAVVIHEQDLLLRPIVIGFLAKDTSTDWHYGRQSNDMGGDWTPSQGDVTEIPQERRGTTGQTKIVLFKTMKGATIIVEEKDGEEWTRIIDRAGQVIEMKSPVTTASNLKNATPRGTKNAITGDQLPYTDIKTSASIRIVDLAGQEVLLQSGTNLEKISVTNQDRTGAKKQILEMNLTAGSERLKLQDVKGSKLDMDGATGDVSENTAKDHSKTIVGKRTTTVGGDDKNTIGGKRDVTVTGDDDLVVTGAKNETVNGDYTETVVGKKEETITGDRKLTSSGKFEASGATEAKLSSGATEIKLTPAGIDITATTANVTCTGPVTVSGNPINLN